jgi:probable rRNA maturation factor
MNRILLSNRQRRIRLPESGLRRLVGAVLRDQGIRGAEVGVVFVDDRAIHALNRQYRNKNRPTDVLAFRLAQSPGELSPPLLGDVVVSVETARRQARQRGIAWQQELCRYVIHGVLHLLGHEDETRRGFARQQRLQEELLKRYAPPVSLAKF